MVGTFVGTFFNLYTKTKIYTGYLVTVKRFVCIAIIGTALILVGQSVMILCLHPTQFTSLEIVLQGAACFVVGMSLYISGMLGLADGYESVAVEIFPLLKIKKIEGLNLAVGSTQVLHDHTFLFWQSYKKVTGSMFVFLLITFGLTFFMQPLSPAGYLLSIGVAAVILGLLFIFNVFQSLKKMRRIQSAVANAVKILCIQPDRILEKPVIPEAKLKLAYQISRRDDRASTMYRAYSRRR